MLDRINTDAKPRLAPNEARGAFKPDQDYVGYDVLHVPLPRGHARREDPEGAYLLRFNPRRLLKKYSGSR